ncbi:MAG: AtpZ/AtpI family protein [Kiritimatiellia bacterium]
MTAPEIPPPSGDEPKEPGPLLSIHRKTVESTQGMSPAILLGSSFALAMGIFAWLGHRWDEKTGRAPLGVLCGVSLGFLYGGYEVWKVIRLESGEGKKAAKQTPKEPCCPPEDGKND